MKILKTLMGFSDFDINNLYRVDTVEWNGRLWLVPNWIEAHATRERQPIRIIAMDRLPHWRMDGEEGVDFQLGVLIPRCVFDGQLPPGSDQYFEIVESPPFRIPLRDEPKPH